jgi:putative colanic acid biosynthesis acetyltransferase WcaF
MAINQYKTNLGNFDNSWYNPGTSKMKRFLWFLTNNILFNSYLLPSYKIKADLLRIFGAEVGAGMVIKPKVNIKYPWKLKIGDNVWIGEDVWIDNLAKVTIGDNVCLSQGAMLLCGNHNYKKSSFDLLLGAITLEEGVWVGAKAIICPGVIAFSHAILTVGSVAIENLEPFFIYQGNPAQKIRERVLVS